MATIGRAAAVAAIGRLQLSGLVAWLAWLLVHITFLIGFRNRVLVLFQWAWAYITWQRGARLITGPWQGRGMPVPYHQTDNTEERETSSHGRKA
jgi:NADH dehydrogenase